MKSIVVHIDEATCTKNNRDPNATKLIEIARTFGTVESLDCVLASERAKSQAVISDLTAQNERIKEFEVTPDELEYLRFIRAMKKKDSELYQAEITKRDDQLKAIQIENENRAAAIKAMYGF